MRSILKIFRATIITNLDEDLSQLAANNLNLQAEKMLIPKSESGKRDQTLVREKQKNIGV
ncbi:hypothetical protein ACFL0M_02045 [Thermodesulfobacteriota bacterium]